MNADLGHPEPAPTSPNSRLRAWLHERGHTLETGGGVLGCSYSHLGKLCTGRAAPSLPLAVRIARATAGWWRGPITPDQWVGDEPRRRAGNGGEP